MSTILGLIPARGGSKGIPGKNLRLLSGQPLIWWTLQVAQRSGCVSRLIVSSDDEEIRATARRGGAEAPFARPAELATDAATSVSVAAHALDWLAAEGQPTPDFVLQLQPTSPLRLPEDIAAAVKLQRETGAPAVVSVGPCGHPPQWLRRLGPRGELLPGHEGPELTRRQDTGPVYQLNGAIYLIRTEVFRAEGTFFPQNTVGYLMPAERSLDIDTPWDLELAGMILDARRRDGRPGEKA